MLGNSGAYIAPYIVGCTFENNFVGNDGAGISMTPSGASSTLATVIDSCTFINNESTDRGAGLWYRMIQGESNVVVKNCSFVGNTAGGQGGGILPGPVLVLWPMILRSIACSAIIPQPERAL